MRVKGDIRPAENFWVVMLQTPLKFLGQNLIGDQFWGWSEAAKLCPQQILGPGEIPPVSPLAPGPTEHCLNLAVNIKSLT